MSVRHRTDRLLGSSRPNGATPRFRLGTAAALADQALVSAATFAVLVVAARSMAPDDFGVFALAHTGLLFANSVQFALITQPHNVLGADRDQRAYTDYTASLGIAQAVAALLLALIVLLAGVLVVVVEGEPGGTVIALGFALLAWQLHEFGRRVFYTERRHAIAFANDSVCYGGQVVTIVTLWRLDELTSATALAAMAAWWSVGTGVAGIQLRGRLRGAFRPETLRENWAFGKWLGGATIASWVSSQLTIYPVAMFSGAASAGGLRAAQTMLGPLTVVLLHLSNTLSTQYVRLADRDTADALKAGIRSTLRTSGPVVVLYCAALAVFAPAALGAVFGEGYRAYGDVLVLIAAYGALVYVAQLLAAALNALRLTRVIFRANLFGAMVALPVGIALIAAAGAEGAAATMVFAAVAVVTLLGIGFRRAVQRP